MLTPCDPMDCSLPGSSVLGILQGRILEWVAFSSSRRSSQLRDQTHVSCDSCIAGEFFTFEPLGKPMVTMRLTQNIDKIMYFILIETSIAYKNFTFLLPSFYDFDVTIYLFLYCVFVKLQWLQLFLKLVFNLCTIVKWLTYPHVTELVFF